MDKKIALILGIAAVLIVAAAALGAVSAKATDVNMLNDTFHIPDGFRQVNYTEDSGGDLAEGYYMNDSNATIHIKVYSKAASNLNKNPGDAEKVIAGISGIYNENQHCFRFGTQRNIVNITVSDDALIEQIIK